MTVYEVAFHFGVGADDYFNVLHYDITGDTPLDLQDLTDVIVADWAASLGTVTAGAIQFRSIVYRLDIAGSVGVDVVPTGGVVNGTGAANEWVGQLACLVQKRTNGIVRPNLGRAFVPGIQAPALNAAGEFEAATLAVVETFWDGVILVPFAGNGQAEMLIKASNPTAPNTVPYNSVAECVALAIPSALQTRKKGRGA